jgi:hypothetical protein
MVIVARNAFLGRLCASSAKEGPLRWIRKILMYGFDEVVLTSSFISILTPGISHQKSHQSPPPPVRDFVSRKVSSLRVRLPLFPLVRRRRVHLGSFRITILNQRSTPQRPTERNMGTVQAQLRLFSCQTLWMIRSNILDPQ